jgi:hypothetical protein
LGKVLIVVGRPENEEVLPAFGVDDPKLASDDGGGSRRLIEILMLADCNELRSIVPAVKAMVVKNYCGSWGTKQKT